MNPFLAGDFVERFLAEFLVKLIVLLIERLATSDFAENVVHSIQERTRRAGALKTLDSAVGSLFQACVSRTRSAFAAAVAEAVSLAVWPPPRWMTFVRLAVLHLGALCAFMPVQFDWSALLVLVVLYYTTGALGISLGYHRLLTHRSFKAPKAFEYAATIFGVLAMQGGPISWVATHRKHHAYTGREGDPHDIHRGIFWSHFEWLYRPNEAMLSAQDLERLAPDLARQPFYRFMEVSNVWWSIGLGVLLFALGGWSWLIWGLFVRVVVTNHATWLVNSAAHFSGYQTFRTGDRSTNNWWVALLAWGEGWNNNHHAFPFSARHGLYWYEIDFTWWTIEVLARLKIAREIKLPTPHMIARLRVKEVRQPSVITQ